MKFLSPAKINLTFQIVSKRPDGYHEIASLYQAIDLFDTLTFAPAPRDSLTTSDPTLPSDGRNLIAQALHLFRTHHPATPPFAIHLEKKIPIEAGLGGGSSNAATTLFALSELTGRPLSHATLQQLASQLGSDPPFFFSSGTALCRGRGEEVTSLNPLPARRGVIAKPPFGLSTRAVYQRVDLSKLPPRPSPEEGVERWRRGECVLFNDLELFASELDPRLPLFRRTLEEAGFAPLSLSGSGSAYVCFGNGDRSKVAEASFYPFRFQDCFLRRTIDLAKP